MDNIEPPPDTIYLLLEDEQNHSWLWCQDPDPTGEFVEGVDSFKYTRTEQQPTDTLLTALERLGSSEAFTVPFRMTKTTSEGKELIARMEYARQVIAAAMEQHDD